MKTRKNVSLSAKWTLNVPKLNVFTEVKNGTVDIYDDPRYVGFEHSGGTVSGTYISKIAFSLDTSKTIFDNAHVEYYTSAMGPSPRYGWDGTYGKDGSYSYAYNLITHGDLAPLDELTIRLTGLPSVFKPHIVINGTDIAFVPNNTSIFKETAGDLGSDWWFAGISGEYTGGTGGQNAWFTSASVYIENLDEITPSTKSITL